jgi:hypothetical protein
MVIALFDVHHHNRSPSLFLFRHHPIHTLITFLNTGAK